MKAYLVLIILPFISFVQSLNSLRLNSVRNRKSFLRSLEKAADNGLYSDKLEFLRTLSTASLLEEFKKCNIKLKGFADRNELEHQLALFYATQQQEKERESTKADSLSKRVMAYEMKKELEDLKSRDRTELLFLCSHYQIALDGDINDITESHLRVLVARKIASQRISGTMASNPSLNIDASIVNVENAIDEVSKGLQASIDTLRNFTSSISQTPAESIAKQKIKESDDSILSSDTGLITSKEEDVEYLLSFLETSESFDQIVQVCKQYSYETLTNVLLRKNPTENISRYTPRTSLITLIADIVMSEKLNSLEDAEAPIKSPKEPRKSKKVIAIEPFFFEKDIFNRLQNVIFPTIMKTFINASENILVSSMELLSSFLPISISKATLLRDINGSPVRTLETILIVFGSFMSSSAKLLARWASGGRFEVSTVIAFVSAYAIAVRNGIRGAFVPLLLIKAYTMLANSFGFESAKKFEAFNINKAKAIANSGSITSSSSISGDAHTKSTISELFNATEQNEQ